MFSTEARIFLTYRILCQVHNILFFRQGSDVIVKYLIYQVILLLKYFLLLVMKSTFLEILLHRGWAFFHHLS